jgi:pimeloyl-ACP methyl ester carboxylesterase
MAGWRRVTGAAGLAAGTAAMGAGALLAAERLALRRLRRGEDPSAAEPFGTLRGARLTVLADDGVPLYAEVDGPAAQPVTLIFCHGYCLTQDCWHYQRRDLAGYRMVFWDQRDHGRSGRSEPERATIAQLGADLRAVMEAAAPGRTRVVLVGHSMGGMTIMALAGQHPELFGRKVAGAVLISTAASGLAAGSPWMPALARPLLTRALPKVLDGAARGRRGPLVDRGRGVTGDVSLLGTRFIGFGDGEVSPSAVAFCDSMIRSTPIEVVARYCRALMDCDERDSLSVLGRVPVTVLAGERDRLVAPRLATELATRIPGAQLEWVPGAGHLLILERPALVSQAIATVAGRAARNRLPRSA